MGLNAKARRKEILNTLRGSDVPVSASSLAQQLAVSRQIIVGDVALLRASGEKIASTPRGYIFEDPSSAAFPFEGLIACCHAPEQLQEELYTIVDFGGYQRHDRTSSIRPALRSFEPGLPLRCRSLFETGAGRG